MKKIRDIMTKDVDVIHPNASLVQAADKMKRHNVGVLPVCDGDKLKGMVTDRDIVVRALADKKSLDQTRVSEIMSRGVYYCYDHESSSEAADIMQDKKVRRLVVLNKDKRLVGMLSLEDLAMEKRSGDLIRKTLHLSSHSESSESIGLTGLTGLTGMMSRFRPIVIGSFVLGLGYFLFGQREEVRNRLRQVIPFNFKRDESQVA